MNCNQFGFVNIYHRTPHPKRMFKINEPIHRVETNTSHHRQTCEKEEALVGVPACSVAQYFAGSRFTFVAAGSVALRRSTGARSES